MEIQSIPIIIAFAFIFFVGTYVYLYNPKKKVNRYFFVLSLLNSIFSFLDFHLINTNDPNTANIMLKLAAIWGFIDVFQMHFILIFTKKLKEKRHYWLYSIYGLSAFLIIHFIVVNFNVLPIKMNYAWIPQNINDTPYYQTMLLVFQIGLSIVSLYACITYIVKSPDPKIKTQTILMLFGVLTPVLFGALIIDILPLFNIIIAAPISYAVAVGWMFIAFAIWKYNLFNITAEFASHKIISSINDALLLINYKGYIIEANESFYSMFEIKPQEIEQQPIDAFLKLIKAPEVSLIREYVTNEIEITDIGFINSSGKRLFIDLSTFFITNRNKEILGYVFLIRNTSKLVMAKKEIEQQHDQMVKMAHQAGMAEFATSIMHNIGNVLNSVSVSSEHISSILQKSKIHNLIKSNSILEKNLHNIAEFFSENPKGKVLPDYYIQIGKILIEDHNKLLEESKTLTDRIKIMKDVIDIQQEYATTKEFYELEDFNLIIDEVIQILETSIKNYNIRINRLQSKSLNTIFKVQKSKILNVLLNIIKNSIEALKDKTITDRNITISLKKQGSSLFLIKITDNGIGIHPNDLSSIFAFGYTRKPKGHGFGLHFCANAIEEMNGKITVESDGINKGAAFTILIPFIT